jgi:hypothetical protein
MPKQHHRSRGAAHFQRSAPAPGDAGAHVVPFDYAAQFPITGQPGTVQQDVINISPEAAFVALGISYGFEQERGRSIGPFLQGGGTPFLPGDLTLGQIPIDVLAEGFRVGPRYLPIVFETRTDNGEGVSLTGNFSTNQVSNDFLNQTPVFERVQTPIDIEFLFSMVDTASGREFQDQPTHNISSLGSSDGRRPFRMLSRPVFFLPRSSVRIQIIERSDDVRGTLFIVLFGYKLAGSSGCGEVRPASLGSMNAASMPLTGKVIPFDYVTRFQLQGRETHRMDDEIAVNTEGGYYATSIGYGLQVNNGDVQFNVSPGTGTVDLAAVKLSNFPVSTLTDGFRIKPGFMRLAVSGSGSLNSALPAALVHSIFETLNRAEDVSFRYSIFDSGRGRELQSEPIHNIAGLGIANGDRPFKKLAWPLHLEPRSTLRVSVEERFGRGDLFIVLQGYKLLAGPAPAGARR